MTHRILLLTAAVIFFSLLTGCVMRPAESIPGGAADAPAVSPTPEPTPEVLCTVRYYRGQQLLGEETVPSGSLPGPAPVLESARLLGWQDAEGNPAVPGETPVTGYTAYYAVTRPLLRQGADLLWGDERGFLRPSEPFTNADAAAALRSLLFSADDVAAVLSQLEAAPAEVMAAEGFASLLDAVFAPEEVQAVLTGLPLPENGVISRAAAAAAFASLTDAQPKEGRYFPDAAPDDPAYQALISTAAPGTLDPQALREQTLDGFLWFDGYLYRLDDDGYFICNETVDGLYYGPGGRYSCGDAHLDELVARELTGLMEPGKTRLEHLRAVYLHVKNDFRYLPRNYYASGEKGWEIPEATLMFETRKGNCYNFTGAFCFMARGLGYNAVTYSGTMGTQNQPHSWTEIIMDDGVYICDPEIELNYWLLEMYTDNFMMRVENSGGWNYQSVGRN